MKLRVPLTALLSGLLLAAALLVRLIGLGQQPLTSTEAAVALQAAASIDLGSPFWGHPITTSAPGYHSLTGTLLVWFGQHNFIVRLVPAVFGVALAALPLALPRRFSWPARLLALFLLAFSAASLTASRTADSLTLAAFGVALAAVQVVKPARSSGATRQVTLGIGVGLALTAGLHAWQGLFGLGLAWLLSRVIRSKAEEEAEGDGGQWQRFIHWRTALSASITALLISTGFGVQVEGLAGLLQAPGGWLLGWVQSGSWPLATALALPFIYEPLILLVGVLGAVRSLSSGNRLERLAALWAVGALLAYGLYPARQPGDLLWAVIPLAVLAARQIELAIDEVLKLGSPISSILLALVLLTVLSFAYLMLESSVAGFGLASLDREGQLAFAVTALAFAFLLILLFGIGWSWHETLLALSVTSILVLGMLSFASAWGLNFTRAATQARELWRQQVSTLHLPLLEDTLADIAKWQVGRTDGLEIQVQGQAPDSLAWVLRHHRPAQASEVGVAPPVILAPESTSARLPAEYLGQAFAIQESWGWPGALPPNLLGWLLDRRAPVESDRWILYVRTDVAELGASPVLQGGE